MRQLLSQVGSLDLAVAELRLGLSEGEAVLRRRGGAGARREVDARQLSEEDTVDAPTQWVCARAPHSSSRARARTHAGACRRASMHANSARDTRVPRAPNTS